jgi:hypothetical protein
MDRKEWLAGLSSGDAVVVMVAKDGPRFRKGRVKRITPTGIIVLEDGTRYRPSGIRRGGGWGSGELLDPSDPETNASARKAKADAKAKRAARRIGSLGIALEGVGFQLSRENVAAVLWHIDELERQQDAAGLVSEVEKA